MSDITITEWVSYDEAVRRALPESVGGMGGAWESQTPDEYLSGWQPEAHGYIRAIWAHLDAHGPITGTDHQESRVPVFSDGTAAMFSMRGWGDLVSAWHNGRHPEDQCNYCRFAW